MAIATVPDVIRWRPVASTDDSLAAAEILAIHVGDEPWKLDEHVPGGSTWNAVEIAEDGSAAIFDVYDDQEKPLARVSVSIGRTPG